MVDTASLTSPLHAAHQRMGARMVDFGGWLMPIEYPGAGVVREHTAVRERVGLFDVSHLGKVTVTGPGAAAYLNTTLANDLGKIAPGQAQYTLCCTEAGGVVDDLIAYLNADDDVLLIPNAANTAEVARLLAASAPDGVSIRNAHKDFGVLAVQGPRSEDVLRELGLPVGHGYMSFVTTTWRGLPLTVCRTGYTGERGYELVPRWDDAPALWEALTQALTRYDGLVCGLGARDTLRTEMGYALHGHELSPTITPVQARVGWAVGWRKPAFWGRGALSAEKEAGAARLSRGLLVEGKGIPRAGCAVLSADGGSPVGEVTSGTFSPTLRNGIALALLDRAVSDGDRVVIDVRGRRVPAVVTKPPFVETGVDD